MTVYFYKGFNTDRLERIITKLDRVLNTGNDEITLKNGTTILVYKNEFKYMVYDEDLNLIAEFENNQLGRDELAIKLIVWGK